jgi:hypothetical protein
MADLFEWLESHSGLSGWAQFLGAMAALLVTYFTAFAPQWRRHRQLNRAAARLLQNGYEVIESYHRTSQYFLPTAVSIRAAGLTMVSVAGEIDRFPIFELSDQGPRSTARNLVAVGGQLKLMNLVLESTAVRLGEEEGTVDDQSNIRTFVGDQLKLVEAILTGKELKRPEWPSSA